MNLLEVEIAGYGASQVLFGMNLAVAPGQCDLLGRNGMGKTTTIKTIMGLLRPGRHGALEGTGGAGPPPYAIARLGLGLVPEGRQVFPNLSVRENLVATGRRRGRPMPGPSSA
jgi:branched-chain amino acid transport system ATP-binding protein